MSLEGTATRKEQDEVFDDGKQNVFGIGLEKIFRWFMTSHTYAGAGNEVIVNSKIKLAFASVLMFSGLGFFFISLLLV